MSTQTRSTQTGAFIALITVFFFWGFVAASNGIFIPFCKSHFGLNQTQSQLIDTAFYAAYFVGSLLLWLTSKVIRVDILNKVGYKKGIISGLLLSVLGALGMIPSVDSGSFPLILGSFFVIALGFSLQQTAAQPFVVALGAPESGAHRLNLAGGVNSLGTLLGPIMVSILLFGDLSHESAKRATLSNINSLYLILAGVFVLAAILLGVVRLPQVNNDEPFEPGLGALKFSQLKWGMLAIFTYVGVEVTIQSNMGALLERPDFGGHDESHISQFISLYWGSLMIGRWTAAISVFSLPKSTKKMLTIIVPLVAFGLILLVNRLRGNDVFGLYIYVICVSALIVGFFFGQEKPARMLLVFSMMGVAAMLIGVFTHGEVAKLAFISGGLCSGIMWPCIFALSITGLGKYTSQGSSFLIMMILGGALIPPVQGFIADKVDIHTSYWAPVLCFAFLAWFAVKVRAELKRQGIDVDMPMPAAH